ncbi:hypothetical protein C900_00111 [Fulvivirga imtechensis AK7]|uniref:Uncharacterized protein n=1 Tax=Fulvivirga imtechensis AK7 TaxID=1237149 RepID=L8JVF3_9BACT|nr:hypothetical protein C900_00111 [Fulvivirga imtechensis AK7]
MGVSDAPVGIWERKLDLFCFTSAQKPGSSIPYVNSDLLLEY